ncbi:MAG: hypothetical protein ACTSU5_15700 [Promethearchaeota archaeon]
MYAVAASRSYDLPGLPRPPPDPILEVFYEQADLARARATYLNYRPYWNF